MYFLLRFIKDTVLLKTNKKMKKFTPITWEEFVIFIGLWLLMSMLASKCSHRSYWNESIQLNEFYGTSWRLNRFMSCFFIKKILRALTYTDQQFFVYQNKFNNVRQMISAWNEHIRNVFISSWVSCLNESISIWTPRWTCPGFMYVP